MNDETARHIDETALDRYRTGELEGPERERVAAHLAGCRECAAALAVLERFAAAVGRGYAEAREAAAPGEPDWGRLKSRVMGRVADLDREARVRRKAWARWAPFAGAAAAALLVLVLWREGVRGPEDARRVAAPPVAADRAAPPAASEAEGEPPVARAPAPAEAPAARPAPPAPAERREAAAGEQRADEAAKAAEPAPADAARERDDMLAGRPAAAAPAGPLERYELEAHRALAERDTAGARRALVLWRDTLAPRADLDPGRRREGRALADSLAALLEPE